MLLVEIDRILSNFNPAVPVQRRAGIRIYIESRKVAAGDIQSDAVPLLEQQRGGIHFDREFVGASWFEQFRVAAVAVPAPYNAVTDVKVQTSREIGVRRIDVATSR